MIDVVVLRHAFQSIDKADRDFWPAFTAAWKMLAAVITEDSMQKHNGLRALVKKAGIDPEYAYMIRDLFEEQVARQVRRMAILQYQYMRTASDWGDLGEQRISISYCRQLLNIAHDREVTQEDAGNFTKEFDRLVSEYHKHTPAELRAADEQIKCDLIYKAVDYSREKDIHAFLDFIGSEKGLIAGQLHVFRSVIFGLARIEKVGEYRVTTFLSELARTPATVLSIAAVVGGKHVAIRMASCETIFANKWRGVLHLTASDIFFNLLHEYENIGLAFKLKALLAYKAETLNGLAQKKNIFLDEMVEGLLWHELGHGIVINTLLTKEDSAFGEALGVLGANVIAVMKEILADWAPERAALKGPLLHFCQVAQKQTLRATRMLYVYFSDNWFLGQEEDSFANHTDIMMALIWRYVRLDGSIDFDGLLADLADPKGTFWYVLDEYNRITKYLEHKIKSATYLVQDQHVDFKALWQEYVMRVRAIDKESPEDAIEFLVLVWAKLLEDLNQTNSDLLLSIEEYLEKENQHFHNYLVVNHLQGQGDDLRKLLLSKIKSSGFFYPGTTADMDVSVTELLNYFSKQ